MMEFVSYLAWLLGIPRLARWATRRSRVGIILYHDPTPEVFEAHLRFLREHYSILPFERLLEASRSGNWADLPPNALVIHFDDGYKGNRALLDLCRRFEVVPTLYLCSHVVGTRRKFWSKLKGGRSKQLRLVDNQRLLAKLREEAGYTPDSEFPGREGLSEQELAEMGGQFRFASHGRYHFSALTLSGQELEAELEESRDRVEAITGQRCEHFSFPYGDFGDRELAAVRSSSYQSARTTLPGWAGPGTDPYRLPIVADVPGTASVNVLRFHLTGLPRRFKRLAYVLVTRHIYAVRERILMSRRFFRESDRPSG